MKRKDFEISPVWGDYFTIGTYVVFRDCSYITNERGESVFFEDMNKDCEVYKIIEGNKYFPTDLGPQHQGERAIIGHLNNIKVQNLKTGEIYHCSKVNVLSIEHGQFGKNDDHVNYRGILMSKADVFYNPYPFA